MTPELATEVRAALGAVEAGEPVADDAWERFKIAAEANGADRRWRKPRAYGVSGLLVTSARVPLEKSKRNAAAEDEPEDADESSFTDQALWKTHTCAVVAKAALFAEHCGLPRLRPSLEAAARYHDLGKLDERFQTLLGQQVGAQALAKSNFVSPAERRRLRRLSGYPEGARHEFASVRLAEARNVWPEDCDVDLALFVMGSHHGLGRPFPPVWDDEGHTIRVDVDGTQLEAANIHHIARFGSGWTERYARLTRRYGWWGLALLEALLRRADCVASREQEERSNGRN